LNSGIIIGFTFALILLMVVRGDQKQLPGPDLSKLPQVACTPECQ
jgi:hypothetical protein